jgi:hypothetical protein
MDVNINEHENNYDDILLKLLKQLKLLEKEIVTLIAGHLAEVFGVDAIVVEMTLRQLATELLKDPPKFFKKHSKQEES